jgi:hypothetical protein
MRIVGVFTGRRMIDHERLGLFYTPNGFDWQASHCAVPLVQFLSGNRYRIHFACRDANQRSRGGWVEIEVSGEGLTVVRSASRPSLDLGRLGTFDESGAIPTSLVDDRGRLLLYYGGWALGRTVPFYLAIGLAESTDGGETFTRVSEGPILGRNRHDPFLVAAPWVIKDGGQFRMWYVSGTAWVAGTAGSAPTHYYTIKHAISSDGLDWKSDDHICLPYTEHENAIARPVVTKTGNGYRMIYSARRLGETYRIYVAYSKDGLTWERDREPLLDVAPAGWDSEMVCYGNLLECPHGRFLLYNGNSYGRDGIGAARILNSF